MEGYWGPLIRTVSVLLMGLCGCTTNSPGTYVSMTKTTSFKYNNNKYFWFLNGHIYLPNVDWDAIKLEGVFEEDISTWTCEDDDDCHP